MNLIHNGDFFVYTQETAVQRAINPLCAGVPASRMDRGRRSGVVTTTMLSAPSQLAAICNRDHPNLRDQLSVRTLNGYIANLFMLLNRETGQIPDPRIRKDDLHNFTYNNLVVKEGVYTEAYTKQMANSEDLIFLTKKIYKREFIASFPNMREFLNLNLYICLMVDCCECGGGIVRGN